MIYGIGSAGGHFNNDELDKPYDCIVRELNEELSISLEDIKNLTLRYITLRKIDNEIRQNYYYFAEINEILANTIESNEGNLKWFNIKKLPLEEMPITSKEILKHYVNNRNVTKNIYCGSVSDSNINFSLMN